MYDKFSGHVLLSQSFDCETAMVSKYETKQLLT